MASMTESVLVQSLQIIALTRGLDIVQLLLTAKLRCHDEQGGYTGRPRWVVHLNHRPCDPLLGQREGRDERIIASQHGWPRPFIIGRVVVIVMLDGSRSSAAGPRRINREMLSIVRYTTDRLVFCTHRIRQAS